MTSLLIHDSIPPHVSLTMRHTPRMGASPAGKLDTTEEGSPELNAHSLRGEGEGGRVSPAMARGSANQKRGGLIKTPNGEVGGELE